MEELKGYLIKGSPILVLIIGYFGYMNWTYVDTDDARISAEVIPMVAKVSGIIEKVSVVERQEVKQGDTLAQMEDHSYVKAVDMAESEVSSAQAKLHDAEINQTKASTALKTGEITQEQFTEVRSAYTKATTNLKAAREKVERAKLNLENTKIVAPQDGNIFKKYVDDGAFVSEGQNLFGFVTSGTRWVIGNFSVSQLERIKVGTLAKVKVDGFTGKAYTGEVESLVRRTTAAFAQNPPESSGPDLSKSSSRTVVKIKLMSLTNEDKIKLQDGLPATISITVR